MELRTRTKLKHFFSAVIFLLIAGLLYRSATYLFREKRPNQRLNILSYYLEPRNSLDMVIVGGSGIYRYYDPMYAYELSGMTSFDYACASFYGAFTENAVKEVLAEQNPSLLLIDARRWLPSNINKKRDVIRYYLDSMDLNPNRLDAALKYSRIHSMSFNDTVSLSLDLCLYHNNTSALFDKERWKLIDNRIDEHHKSYFKGFGMISKVKPIKRPAASAVQTTQMAVLPETVEKEYRKMLEYVSALPQDVLLIVTPTRVNKKEMKVYNTLEAIASEYGVPMWNGNLYYDEMGVDFSSDFYNNHHMNVQGARKFTKYLTEYVKEHYDIKDHRNDEIGERWDAGLPEYHERIGSMFARVEKQLEANG